MLAALLAADGESAASMAAQRVERDEIPSNLQGCMRWAARRLARLPSCWGYTLGEGGRSKPRFRMWACDSKRPGLQIDRPPLARRPSALTPTACALPLSTRRSRSA